MGTNIRSLCFGGGVKEKMKFIKNNKGSMAILGILVLALSVAVGAVVGLSCVALSKATYDSMADNFPTAANTAMSTTTSTIYSAWPLSALAVLAAFGALAIGVFVVYLGAGGRR